MAGGWGTPIWMGGEPAVDVETFVQGHDQQIARQLLTACDELGLDRINIRAVRDGFIVPNAVWDHVQSVNAGI